MTTIVDGHTHIFNLGFLPVEGVLLTRGVSPRHAAVLTDFFINRLERTRQDRSFAPDPLISLVSEELRAGRGRMNVAADDFFTRFANAVPDEALYAFVDLLTPELEQSISPRVRAETMQFRLAAPPALEDPLRRRLDLLLREADARAGPIETGGADEKLLSKGVGSIVKWLCLLIQHESRILEAFPDAWDLDSAIAGQVHMMMDMKNHYPGRPPEYDFETEQIDRMEAAASEAEIPLYGFVAFDPFRPNSLDIVRNAVEKRGFTGVKFYPPNGYKAAGNLPQDIVNGPPPEEVDARNMRFFQWCVESDTPVFTHCTPEGMESRPNVTGVFSDPWIWRELLRKPGMEKLRLCFGHAGGEKGWTASISGDGQSGWRDTYAATVVELCATYENVFCDFGYFDGILNGKADLFAARLEWVIRASPEFAKKCCYGTDWHLMTVDRRHREYAAEFARLLRENVTLQPISDGFLRGNVLRYLKAET